MAAIDFILNDRSFVAAIEKSVVRSTASAMSATAEAAIVVQNRAKQNASGRPGPNVVTGRLRSSIQIQGPTPEPPFGAVAKVGPTVVYGRAVELGNPRSDSGASYPFLGPAVEQTRAAVMAIYARRFGEAVR